jgi:tryptophan synthase alpha subunit
VREVGAAADGVVVGSALVNVIKDNLSNRAAIPRPCALVPRT